MTALRHLLCRQVCPVSMVLAAVVAGLAPASAAPGGYLGPLSLLAAKDGKTLFVALADARQIAFLDVAGRKVLRSVPVPAQPEALACSPDGRKLYVACAAPKSTVCVIDTATGTLVDSIPAGHTADALAIAPDGKRLYVCNRFNNNVAVIDLAGKRRSPECRSYASRSPRRSRPTASRSSWPTTCRWTARTATTWRPPSA